MSYNQLKAFHYVALFGGFTRAAANINITQPGLSEQVRKLERDYDILLFNRQRKQISLTSSGEKLFLLTKKLFEVEEQVQEYLSENRGETDGCLRIIADSIHHVTEILTEFRRRYPKVFVLIKSGNSEEVVENLRSYDAEIGILGSLSPGSDLEILQLGATEIVAIAAKGFLPDNKKKMNLKALSSFPLIFREAGSKTLEKVLAEADRKGLVLKPVIQTEGREAMLEVVASGAGIGFISKAEVGKDERLAQIGLDEENLRMTESIAYLEPRKNVRAIRIFRNIAEAFVKDKNLVLGD